MKTVNVQKIIENPKYKYTFEFDEVELALLLMYLNKTGGHPKTSYRAIADTIRNEILNAITKSDNNQQIHYIVEKLRDSLCEENATLIFKSNEDEN